MEETLDILGFLADYKERAWMKHAACKGMDTSLFFPEMQDKSTIPVVRKTCGACPVSKQCEEYGRYERFGFWGGKSTSTRKAERRKKS